MLIELQSKAEKYETKVAQYQERARQTPEGPQRAFYQGMADYYAGLATDFRQVLARRQVA